MGQVYRSIGSRGKDYRAYAERATERNGEQRRAKKLEHRIGGLVGPSLMTCLYAANFSPFAIGTGKHKVGGRLWCVQQTKANATMPPIAIAAPLFPKSQYGLQMFEARCRIQWMVTAQVGGGRSRNASGVV